MSRLIEMHDVSVTYPGGVRALSGVSARFSPGEFVVIVGLSGAGKSTLLRTLNGLVKPTAGDVTLFGESLVSSSPAQLRRLRRDVGMIFQTFHVVKRATVLHNVLAGRVAHTSPWRTFFGLWSRRDVEVAWSCLKRVGVAEKAYVRADRLSGGQQQRVGIARALAQEPKVLLADEPVASLDPRTARAIMRDLKKIQQDEGLLTIVNLHSIELAHEFADRIIGLRDGRVVFDGRAGDMDPEMLAEIYGEDGWYWEDRVGPAETSRGVIGNGLGTSGTASPSTGKRR